MNTVLAVDIGGTNLREAVVTASGSIVLERRQPIDLSRLAAANQAEATERMIGTIVQHLEPEILRHRPQAVGVGFPGFFDGRSRRLIASPNLPYVRELPLPELLQRRLGVPVFMQNDALCAAIGEHRFGAGRDAANLLHLTLGTGIGGGLILEHRPWPGEFGMAAEFGHLRIHRGHDARRCGCGKSGCVEAYASATAIQAIYLERTGIRADARDIHARAVAGEAIATEVWTLAGHALGMAIAQCVILLDIHRVTLSGGLTGAWGLLQPAIRKALEEELIPPQRTQVAIVHSILNDQAGLLGAAMLAFDGLAAGPP